MLYTLSKKQQKSEAFKTNVMRLSLLYKFLRRLLLLNRRSRSNKLVNTLSSVTGWMSEEEKSRVKS
jgi:hypothetical protein